MQSPARKLKLKHLSFSMSLDIICIIKNHCFELLTRRSTFVVNGTDQSSSVKTEKAGEHMGETECGWLAISTPTGDRVVVWVAATLSLSLSR